MNNEERKEQLKKDIDSFNKNYVSKIAHTDINNDKFDNLGVLGNFYSLAVDNYPDVAKAYSELSEYINNTKKERDDAYNEAYAECKAILEQNGIKHEGKYASVGDYSCSIPRIFWNNNFVQSAQDIVRMLLLNKDKYLGEESVERYLMLKAELENGEVGFFRRGSVQREIKNLEMNDLFVPNYNKLIANIDAVKKADMQLKKSAALRRYKSALEKIDNLKNPNFGTVEKFRETLIEKSSHILGMAYAKLYKDNFEILRMSSVGAKQKLLELTTKDVEYYAKYNIECVAKDLSKYVAANSIASTLHDKWRDGRKQEDGTFTPRWKIVKDETFINAAKEMETLPKNIRIVNGTVEQDIANTDFNDLCLDYKLENFEAAIVAHEVARNKYTRDKAGVVGKLIHDKWLERNSWAKGSDLDVEFEDLITSEQVKDLIQYEIAKERSEKKELTSLI